MPYLPYKAKDIHVIQRNLCRLAVVIPDFISMLVEHQLVYPITSAVVTTLVHP